MKKKLQVQSFTFCMAFGYTLTAQENQIKTTITSDEQATLPAIFGIKAPNEQWEAWLQSGIAEYRERQSRNMSTPAYSIPVIVHILYKQGVAKGTNKNIALGQIHLENSTNVGVVMATEVFGCKAKYPNGYYARAAYTYGGCTTHEVGYWLGLRHTNGDGNCATDYCNDTPSQTGLPYERFSKS